MNFIKLISLLLATLFLNASLQDDDKKNMNDGPYLEYKNDVIEMRSIEQLDGISKVSFKSFSINEKENVPVMVNFTNHPKWNFSVKLRASIKNEPVEFKQPEKILALSDIEGEFKAFRELLLANKVIDEQYNWIFGKGHLIICGDLFDRGSDVVATIWLLYKMETDAKEKGGYVHTILGNHDIMNLSGDVRYVKSKYFDNAKLMSVDYKDLYSANTELGRWLRSKNIIEKIGDNLCLHGGMAPEINALKMSLKEINNKCRPYYDLAKKPEAFTDKDLWKFFDGTKTSLFWYRGYFKDPKASDENIQETLSFYKVKRVIVGHTIIDSNVAFYYGGKVLGIAVNQHKGKHEGALYENKKWYKINTTGSKELLSF